MAKAAFNLPFGHPFSTSLGDCSMYTRRDSNKLVIRSKGGPSNEKIKNDPAFEKTRNQNSEFGGCSKAAKMMRDAIGTVGHLADVNLHAQATKLISAIRALDNNPKGKRSIIFSRGKQLIEGFNINKATSFDSVITSPIGFSINRNEHSAVLELPGITPGMNFNRVWTYPYYRIRINLGVIRDMVFVEGAGYKHILKDVTGYTETLDTEWFQASSKTIGQEVGLTILDPVLDESCHLLLTVGIEFGTAADGEIKTIRHAGCAKVLGMG